MTKRVKRMLITMCSFLFTLCLGISAVVFGGANKTIEVNAAGEPTVAFDSIDATQNNTNWSGQASWKAVYVNFTGGTLEGENYSTVPAGVSYTVTGTQPTAFYVWRSGNQLQFLFQEFNALADGSTLTIEEGTELYGQTFPEVNLKVENGVWVYVEPTPDPEPTTATFVGVDANQNNKEWPSATSWQATYLNFEGGTFTGVNGGATSGSITYTRSGEGSETNFVVWSAAGTGQLQLLWETPNSFADGSTIHIEEGTVVDGLTLPEVNLIVENGKWVPKATFVGVDENQNNKVWPTMASWQATYLNFEGGTFTGANGGATSGSITYTRSGEGSETNFAVWSAAGTGQLQLLWETPNSFADGSTIHIEEGTVVDGLILPEVNLRVENGKWVKVEPALPVANFTGIVEGYNFNPYTTGRHALLLGFDQPMASAATADLSTVTGNTLNITLNGNAVTIDSSHILPRSMKVVTTNANALELVFFNYDTTGTEYATGVTSSFANNTKLEIKDSVVNGYALQDVTLYFNAETKQWQKEKVPTVSFESFGPKNYDDWNGSGTFYATYLTFSGTFAEGQYTSSGIYYTDANGENKTSFGFIWAYDKDTANGANGPLQEDTMINLMVTGNIIPAGSILRIEKNTEIGGQVLPEVILYMNYEGNWQDTVPEAPKTPVTFEGIEWNNDYGGANVLLLKYAGPDQYAISNGVLDLTTTVGESITINGTKISEMSGSKIESRPDYGAPFLLIQYDTSYATHGAVLTIPANTEAGNAILPALTLYMNAETNKWQDTVPEPLEVPKANYVKIFSSDMSGTVWNAHSLLQIEFDRALAPNTPGIQGAETPANNSGNLSSQLTLGGEHVTMGSQVNFYLNAFAYATVEGGDANSAVLEILFLGKKASDFAHATKLHIPDGTLFGEVQLGEVTLYFNAETGAWQTEKPAPLVSGFSTVEGGSVRISANKETGGLRFETHLAKSTYQSLVETYGKENIKIGTYILPEAYLGLSSKNLEEYVKAYKDSGSQYILDISTLNADKGDFGFFNSDSDGNITDGNNYYIYHGTIANVKAENYTVNFIGVGYIWVKDGEGEEYLYLTHDGSWSRNVYEVAKAAYADTDNNPNYTSKQLDGITRYFDQVIEVSTSDNKENTLVYDIVSVLAARPSHDYTNTNYTVKLENGVITITSTSDETYSVIINGILAGKIEANDTAYADYYAVNATLYQTVEEATALNFGFGEPTQELWGTLETGFNKTFGTANLNNGSTATNIAKVNKEYNGNTARIWFQIADVCWPNDLASFAFLDGSINTIQGVVKDFRYQGVTNISLMSGVANYRSTKNYYKDGTWYSFWEDLNGGIGAIPYPNLIVLPNEDDYEEFLALQKEYFKQLALNVEGITTIEILNELETSMLNQTRFGIANGYAPDIKLIAQAAMDICKAATDGVKEAGKDIKIMMPALCCVSEIKDGNNVTRYNSVTLLEAEYAYIMGENGTKNADDYFQIINIHPYVSISSDTSDVNYLYYENNGVLTLQTPTQIKDRWVAYMNSLRTIFVKNGDAEKPVWITEFGIADYESCNDTPLGGNKWSDYCSNKVLRQAQVFQVVYDAIMDMPYIDSVLFFRVGDYAHTEHNYADCGEATYGIIDQNGALKDIGKYMYAIVNGVNVFTDSDYTTLKELSASGFGDFYAKITAFENTVEGIY